ncbi:SGNH/GDSL hydrolase family protein [Tenacibaculum sp. 1B UA]|uniref:SGNH/GDSL hydrolase family protein n=1 Tax=Tenacibaculum sp. 1B UA TaxID=2922252 RepID=UPI002A23FE76|nr:SGNH/GDSL hydrolase family protein [Tenacibaculum sp. 1B UA]MDX8553507.1 SGNH/GDSL hydrolase family protein [Tenacibaculum sp. 1B UA]
MKKLLYLLLFLQISAQAQQILFVGNSLTYTNSMPKILEYIGKQQEVIIKTKSLCFPNYAIIDHINDGKLQKLLAKKQFDYVIIQQGPSSQTAGKRMLIQDGATIQALCEQYNTKLGYFMVWPSVRYYHTFNKVIENHKSAAKQNNAYLFPVGNIWKEYNTYKGKESLYSLDNFHPSTAGSFVAALTIFHQLYPTKNLQQLPFKKYKKWVTDEDSFNLLVQLVQKY